MAKPRFVEFTHAGRRYRTYDEGGGAVSIERITSEAWRPVNMPGDALLDAARAALGVGKDDEG
jgi:hypothetical protein